MKPSIIRQRDIPQTKINVLKAIYRPILTYESEICVVTKRENTQIQAADVKFIRKVKRANRTDRMRNKKGEN